MKLPEKLISLRKQNRLSQLELAEKLDVSRQAVSKWEVGTAVPSTENLRCLSKLYHVQLEYLLDESKEAPPPISSTEQEEKKFPKSGIQQTRKPWIRRLVIAVITLLLVGCTFLYRDSQKNDDMAINEIPGEKVIPKEMPEFSLYWESERG